MPSLRTSLVSGLALSLMLGGAAFAQQTDPLDPSVEEGLDSLLQNLGQEREQARDLFDQEMAAEDAGDSPFPSEEDEALPRLVPLFVPGLETDSPPEETYDEGVESPSDADMENGVPVGEPAEDVVEPVELIEQPVVLLRGLDKISGDTSDLYVETGANAIFGGLRVTAKACFQTPPTEPPESIAYLEVEDYGFKVAPEDLKSDKVDEKKRVFKGWMYASSPGIHALEHPIYDIWVMRCMADAPDLSSDESESQASNSP